MLESRLRAREPIMRANRYARKIDMIKARRRSKNSGGGIAPAAIGALIEGGPCSVNAFGCAYLAVQAPASSR